MFNEQSICDRFKAADGLSLKHHGKDGDRLQGSHPDRENVLSRDSVHQGEPDRGRRHDLLHGRARDWDREEDMQGPLVVDPRRSIQGTEVEAVGMEGRATSRHLSDRGRDGARECGCVHERDPSSGARVWMHGKTCQGRR